MSECLVITRGGWGDVWRVETREAAYLHPLWHPSDTLVSAPHEFLDVYSPLEWPRLFRMAGGEDFERSALTILGDERLRQSQKKTRLEQYAQGLWDKLYEMSQPIPDDPDVIVKLVRDDRTATIQEGREISVADTQKTSDKTEKTKTEKKAPTPRQKAFALDSVVNFGVKDADNGINYDADANNPKRVNSESRERFAKYRDGMTVQQFVDSVGNEAKAMADLKWDAAKGYVTVTPAAK